MEGLAPDGEGRRAAVRGSLVFGAVYFGLTFYWILVALIWFTWMATLAFLGSMLLLCGLAAFFGWMLHRSIHDAKAPMWLALPVTWTAAEWFRAHWPGPLAFPWLGLGSSLSGFPELVGMAEIVGARGVTFWLALINGLLAAILLRRRGGGRMAPLVAVTAAVVLLPPAWGVWRARTLEVREVGRVAVVQPNIPEHIKLDPRTALDSTFASLDRLVPRIEPGSVKLVVFPEVTFPLHPRAEYAEGFMLRVQAYAREVGAPLMFGGIGFEGDVYGEYTPFNSVFLMEPQGLTDFQYDKRYLVPVVERMPFLPISWVKKLPYFGQFGVGQGWPTADVEGTEYAPLVCYESTYPEGARTFRRGGADVLVNVTNDAWYGREPLYARTTALWQHPAHMVMRAIENRMGVARAANTGISLFVDPVGRVYDATPLFTADVRTDMVYTTDVVTFYTRFGDLVGNGAAMGALVLILAAWGMGRRYGRTGA
jgi:apolipoprotein N-acyltransferase